MARWVLNCSNCNEVFTHSSVDDVGIANYFMLKKPDFPADGVALECPNCRQSATYQQSDLRYLRQ